MKNRIGGLDLLRFAAASLVMLFHLGAATSVPTTTARIAGGAITYPELSWSRCGWVGVQIFFVISGIVIAYSANKSSPGAFLRNRILRLYPAVWLVAPLSAAVLFFYSIEPASDVGRAFLHSVLLFPFPAWVDDVYWTLGIEMAFYGTVYLLLIFASSKRLITLCWIIGGVSAAYWLAGALVEPSWIFDHLWDRTLDLTLIHHGIYFAFGILLYRWRAVGWSWSEFVFVIVLMGAALIQIDYARRFAETIFGPDQQPLLPIIVFLLAMIAAMAALCFELESRRWLYLAGLATYPLYLLHDYFGAAVLQMVGVRLGADRFVAFAVAVIVCIAASFAIVRVELPLRRSLARILDSLQTPGGSVGPVGFLRRLRH